MNRFPNWMRLSLEPDELIGEHKMRRWWIFPANPWFNAYVHEHVRNDPRTLHDHPCDNISIRLRGRLVEFVPLVGFHPDSPVVWGTVSNPKRTRRVHFDSRGMAHDVGRPIRFIRFCRAEDAHRLELVDGKPAWTLWIRFRNRRKWGFFEPTGWRLARSRSQPGIEEGAA